MIAKTANRKSGAYTVAAVIAALVLAGFVMPAFWIRIMTGVFMWIALAASWNIIGGYGGYISFGHGAFFGVGAYITGLLMGEADWPFLPAMLVAGVGSAIFGYIIGFPTLRLRGAYCAIATWAFAEGIKQLVLVLPFTGGAFGLRLPAMLNDQFFYLVMLALAGVTLLTVYLLIEKGNFGLKLKSIREDELASETVAIDTVKVKLQAFSLSAFFPGLVGGAYAYWLTYIHPDSVLGAVIADQMVIMTLFGGLGTVMGPVIGATLLWLANRFIWTTMGESSFYLVILGLAIMLVILFLPDGLMSLIVRRPNRRASTAPPEETAGAQAPVGD
ncbi:MAG: branched-chain amino acid ABC transporter permease [Actinobacteria bacterium]|nr:branched-chain amino acid ABC transporter permease [Actinomycetota bacterium]